MSLDVVQNPPAEATRTDAPRAAKGLRDLLKQWQAEDATEDAEELRRRDEQWSQILLQLDADRHSTRPLTPPAVRPDLTAGAS